MRTIERIWEFKTAKSHIVMDAVEDCDIDLSFDEDGSVLRKLNSGELMAFGVLVRVFVNGVEVGTDSLWNCIYERPSEFKDHLGLASKGREDGKNYGSYFVDMIRSAIGEARKTIQAIKASGIKAA